MLLWHCAMHISGALELGDPNGKSESTALGAARAWHAEISSGAWSDQAQLLAAFPSALTDGNRILFDLGEADHCVIARFNYEMQAVRMNYFGPRVSAPWPVCSTRKTRKMS